MPPLFGSYYFVAVVAELVVPRHAYTIPHYDFAANVAAHQHVEDPWFIIKLLCWKI